MKLIIAEKPSLGRNISNAIGSMTKRNGGYLEGNGYIVTWAFGHLFTLCDIEDYLEGSDSTDKKWKLDNLPCFPKTFKFALKKSADKQPDSGINRQFELIKSLCNREDVETIINAGDSDREGEIIIRICLSNALNCEKSCYRLWLPDQTEQTINKALSELKLDSEYNSLANEGFARMYTDWLYGVNLTRYATIKSGTLLRVGRVIIPIVKAIYDRDMAIRNFKPEIYYAIFSDELTNGEKVELLSKSKFGKDEKGLADEFCKRYNACEAIVKSVKNKKDTLSAGKLYSLTKLQNYLGKKYKMQMSDSLSIVQKLYEEGYITYPRTNSEYLAVAEKDKIASILNIIGKMGYPVEMKTGKNIFDDSKIESHSAITPTYKIPKKDNLSEDEFTVYSTIFRRFAAVFCSQPCVVNKTEIVIDVGGLEDFTLKGMSIIEKGWMKYDDSTQKDKILPKLVKGDRVNIDFKPIEKETTPPRHYTIETLNNYLKNPFKDEKSAASDDDSDEYKAIFEGLELGTEATRTGIIENALKSKYINLKKDVYTILKEGEYLIESLARMDIAMDKFKTSTIGCSLKKVYRNEMTVDESLEVVKNEISEVFKHKDSSIETDTDFGIYGDTVGKCPLCGSEVYRSKYSYCCKNYKGGCKFMINLSICSRVISVSNVKRLLETGETSKIQGFVSKNGKSFDAILKLTEGKVVFKFQ